MRRAVAKDLAGLSGGWGRIVRTSGTLAASLVTALVIAAATVSAQVVPAAPGAQKANSEQDALFQQILKNPGNLDLAFRHAEVATAAGDYEAAIGSLERLLFFNPNLPRVMLELGVLYFRLGSYEMSREYFKKATAGPDVPQDVRVRVDAYLAEIEKRLNPNQTTGFAQTGVRYQTNANAGPSGTQVRVFGFDASLDREFVKAADWNWFAQGGIRNIIDFGNQRGDSWETAVNTYLTRQNKFSRLNTALIDLQTGPRLALFPDDLYGLSYRPYVGATGINLGDSNYLSAQTLGNAIAWTPSPGWNFEAGLERARRSFHNSSDYPTVETQSGFMNTGYFNGSGLLFGGWTWTLRGALAKNDSEGAWQSFRQRGVDLSLAYSMAVPIFGADRRVTIIPFAGYLGSNFKEPDVLVDPTMARRDHERRVGLAIDTQITEQIGFGLRVQYQSTLSNIPNYATDNLSVFGGPTVKF